MVNEFTSENVEALPIETFDILLIERQCFYLQWFTVNTKKKQLNYHTHYISLEIFYCIKEEEKEEEKTK